MHRPACFRLVLGRFCVPWGQNTLRAAYPSGLEQKTPNTVISPLRAAVVHQVKRGAGIVRPAAREMRGSYVSDVLQEAPRGGAAHRNCWSIPPNAGTKAGQASGLPSTAIL